MSPSRYNNSDRVRVGKREDPFRGQRGPTYGLIMALINLGLKEPSLVGRRDRSRGQIAGYLAYQVPSTIAVVGVAIAGIVGLASLLN